MNKTAIKNYAVWARVQLIEAVRQRAFEYEITEDGGNKPDLDSINGRVLSANEKEQRATLIGLVKQKGYAQVMEEAAYTWFNRFIALRFMEVNGYLPSKTRVFTDENNNFKPEILKQAMTVELDGLDREKVYDLLDKQNNEELYKYLLITQCNALNAALPDMFEKIANWTELLFPNNLLKADSVLERMILQIPENDWTEQVEIIGWLYQYYNTEPKDKVFARPSGQKIRKEDVPAATQLFTPDWIVRYMIENSLGRIAVSRELSAFSLESEQQRQEKEKEIAQSHGWQYYLAEAEQAPEVRAQLNADSREQNTDLTQICVLDPCMGSGHILVYAFDVFMEIYKSQGYSERDAAQEIVRNNLYGLELDDRAAQLAYFAVMMKARSYDRRFLTRGIYPHLCSIQESNSLSSEDLELFGELTPSAQRFVDAYYDAKEYGSVLTPNIDRAEFERVKEKYFEIEQAYFDNVFDTAKCKGLHKLFPALILQTEIMQKKYNVVCTNPPYMGGSGMSAKLSTFVKKYYPDSKADLSTVFMEKCIGMCSSVGYVSMINIPVWMFLSSYEKLRKNIIAKNTFVNMVHPGRGVFGSDFGTVTFTFAKNSINNYNGTYYRLFDVQGEVKSNEVREQALLSQKGKYIAKQSNFSKIPGSPIAYWVSDVFLKVFENKLIGDIADSKQGVATADNNRFLRLWFECNKNMLFLNCSSHEESSLSNQKWYPYNKGGEFRKWYGNNDYVVNWYSDGMELKAFKKSVLRNPNYYFQECFSWSLVTSSVAAFRYKPNGHIFDVAGMSCFSKNNLLYLLGLCNTKVVMEILKVIAPTINFQCGDIANIPVILAEEVKPKVDEIVNDDIKISKSDWDSFETSWDFKKHPLI